jgi:O-antigen ligase
MSSSLRTLFPVDMTRRDVVVLALLFVFLVSIPPKWSGVPVVGILLVGMLLTAKRAEWSAPSLRAYLFYTALWMVPVIIATVGQHLMQVETATPWDELVKLILRMLGVGLGILLLLERRWISLSQLTFLVLVALSLHALAGVVEWILHPDASLLNWRKVRVQGDTGSPNSLAIFVALAMIVCVWLLKTRRRDVLLWSVLLVAFVCLLATGARSGLLALVAGMVILFPPVSRRSMATYLLAIAIGGFGVFLVANQQSIVQGLATSNSLRIDAMAFGIEMIGKAPLLGWGFESFTRLPGHSGVNAPHNVVIDLALSCGVIALAGWLITLALIGHRLIVSQSPSARLLLALFVAALIYANLEASLLVSNQFRGIWILLLATSCHVLAGEASATESRSAETTSGNVQA